MFYHIVSEEFYTFNIKKTYKGYLFMSKRNIKLLNKIKLFFLVFVVIVVAEKQRGVGVVYRHPLICIYIYCESESETTDCLPPEMLFHFVPSCLNILILLICRFIFFMYNAVSLEPPIILSFFASYF